MLFIMPTSYIVYLIAKDFWNTESSNMMYRKEKHLFFFFSFTRPDKQMDHSLYGQAIIGLDIVIY